MKSKKIFRNKINTVKLNESRKYNKSKLKRHRRYTQRGGNESQNNNLSKAEELDDLFDDTTVRDIIQSTRSAATKGGKQFMKEVAATEQGLPFLLGGITKYSGKAYNSLVQTGKMKKKIIDILVKSGKLSDNFKSLTSEEQKRELSAKGININEKINQIKEKYSDLKQQGLTRMNKKKRKTR